MERRLSILIATTGRRNQSFLRLMNSLVPQIERNNIEVIAYWNSGEKSIGEIRQALMKQAVGEYICFIDDDDRIPDYYCDEIFWALGKDYVGFEVELFEKDKKMPRVYHSIRYGVWHEDEEGYYRGITHLNPIKRAIALKGTFGKQGLGEDASWAKSIAAQVNSENYIDKIMYYYMHDKEETLFGGIDKPYKEYKRPEFVHPQFRYHPASKKKGCM